MMEANKKLGKREIGRRGEEIDKCRPTWKDRFIETVSANSLDNLEIPDP